MDNRKELNAERLGYVLTSLTPNHRSMLLLLVKHHRENPDTPGLLHREYCDMSLDCMFATSDQRFREIMTELIVRLPFDATHYVASPIYSSCQ